MKVKKLQTKMAILGAVLALAGLQVMAQNGTRLDDAMRLPNGNLVLIVDEDFIDNGINCSDVDFATFLPDVGLCGQGLEVCTECFPNSCPGAGDLCDSGDICVSIEECAFSGCNGGDHDPDTLVNDDDPSIPGVAGGCQHHSPRRRRERAGAPFGLRPHSVPLAF